MLQLYGCFSDHWSHAQVSRGFVRGLVAHGIKPSVFNVDGSGCYDGLDDVDCSVGHVADAAVGFYVGGYPPFSTPWLEDHPVKVALFISESSTIPPDWAAIARQCDLVAVPSGWVEAAYTKAGVPAEKLLVVPHGLHKIYEERQLHPRPPGGAPPLVFGHVAGAASFLERKGTPQLVKAFTQAFTEGEAVLQIRTPATPGAHAMVARARGLVRLVPAEGKDSPGEMRDWYRQLDFLIQPSRAEAFGICPLEARSQGVPVILTWCAGHCAHQETSDGVIPSGLEAPITVNGIPNGMAPTVRASAIRLVLQVAATREGRIKTQAKTTAREYYAQWAWPVVLTGFAQRLKKLLRKHGRRKSTLNEKMGV